MNEKLLKIRTLGELEERGLPDDAGADGDATNLSMVWPEQGANPAGIVGYEETVVPEIENGALAGHHMIFLW